MSGGRGWGSGGVRRGVCVWGGGGCTVQLCLSAGAPRAFQNVCVCVRACMCVRVCVCVCARAGVWVCERQTERERERERPSERDACWGMGRGELIDFSVLSTSQSPQDKWLKMRGRVVGVGGGGLGGRR